MAAGNQVKGYFDRVAPGYRAASSGAIWRRVRGAEEQAFFALIGDVADRDVLELGCGAGHYTRALLAKRARHVWAVDFSERMLAELPAEGVTAILGDAAAVAPGRTFDILVSAGMLEFVPDPVAVLRNAHRLATPGARLTILHPTDGLLARAYRRFHRGNGLAIRLFGRELLEQTAARAGWRVTARSRAGPYSACARLVKATPA